jgi:hypothetical protein
MAKKNSMTRKVADDAEVDADQLQRDVHESASAEATSPSADDSPPARAAKPKAAEETSSGNVGLSDIRKAVAFANSVGGLDKAIALLQIVKVAKEVQ